MDYINKKMYEMCLVIPYTENKMIYMYATGVSMRKERERERGEGLETSEAEQQ